MPRLNDTEKPKNIEQYGERVAKYIPVEILAFYATAVNLIATKKGPTFQNFRLWWFGIAGILLCVITPVWIGRFSNYKPSVIRTNQIMASFAFIVWAYSFPAGWFKEMDYYDEVVAGLSLLIFTIVSALITPKDSGARRR